MIEILEKGIMVKPEYAVCCPRCKCKIKYSELDEKLEKKILSSNEDYIEAKYIECPICKNNVLTFCARCDENNYRIICKNRLILQKT